MMDNEVIIIANCQQTAINSSRVCLLPRSRRHIACFYLLLYSKGQKFYFFMVSTAESLPGGWSSSTVVIIALGIPTWLCSAIFNTCTEYFLFKLFFTNSK